MQHNFDAEFDQTLRSILIRHGFNRIKLNSCIQQEQLWQNRRVWFGISYDWRDQYLEANLGHLYWFRDVMPRVIILGNYSSYVNFNLCETFRKHGLSKTIKAIEQTFEQALEKYAQHYDNILKSKLYPPKVKYAKEFHMALGDEVKEHELRKYYTQMR